jgi:hypothetical protein
MTSIYRSCAKKPAIIPIEFRSREEYQHQMRLRHISPIYQSVTYTYYTLVFYRGERTQLTYKEH